MRTALCIAAAMFFASLAHASDITYNINIAYSDVSAVGTVTTDGAIGNLSGSDITGLNVVITDAGNSVDVTGPDRFATSGGFTASTTGLFFDFSSANYLLIQDLSGNDGYLCLQGPSGHCDDNGNGNAVGNISIQVPYVNGDGVFEDMSGVQEFATTGVAATPEPSSLALLGTGLLGFAGVMKRRLL